MQPIYAQIIIGWPSDSGDYIAADHRNLLAQKADLERVQQLLEAKVDLEILVEELEVVANKSQVTAIEDKVSNVYKNRAVSS